LHRLGRHTKVSWNTARPRASSSRTRLDGEAPRTRHCHMMKLLAGAAALTTAVFSGGAVAATKPAIVLVHGAWEDSNVWGEVTPRLQKDGYRVVVVSLPGRPSAPAMPDKVSLDLYRDTVLRAVDSVTGPVVLVGHSFGGFPISAAAQSEPAKVK